MRNQVPKESHKLQEEICYKVHSFGGFHVVPISIWKRLSFLLLEYKTELRIKLLLINKIILSLY